MELTKKEKAWVASVQRALDSCPSKRIGFYTIGDPVVFLYDRQKDHAIDLTLDKSSQDFDGAVQVLGASFDVSLDFPANVHSTAG